MAKNIIQIIFKLHYPSPEKDNYEENKRVSIQIFIITLVNIFLNASASLERVQVVIVLKHEMKLFKYMLS